MSIDKLKPVSENHSIKEATVSIFLSHPFSNPKSLLESLKEDLKSSFNKFSEISAFKVEFKAEKGALNLSSDKSETNIIGFKLESRFNDNSVGSVLQGINESNRTFISYHDLKYVRWNDFQKSLFINLEAFAKKDVFYATAFSLHYVDQFRWESNEEIKVDEIFNSNGSLLPNEFFKCKNNLYVIVTEKESSGYTYFDRIEVRFDYLATPIISVSHNVTQKLGDKTLLKNLLNSNDFSDMLNLAHNHNKLILRQLLTEDVQKLIKL